jgi:hypothetical protein
MSTRPVSPERRRWTWLLSSGGLALTAAALVLVACGSPSGTVSSQSPGSSATPTPAAARTFARYFPATQMRDPSGVGVLAGPSPAQVGSIIVAPDPSRLYQASSGGSTVPVSVPAERPSETLLGSYSAPTPATYQHGQLLPRYRGRLVWVFVYTSVPDPNGAGRTSATFTGTEWEVVDAATGRALLRIIG